MAVTERLEKLVGLMESETPMLQVGKRIQPALAKVEKPSVST